MILRLSKRDFAALPQRRIAVGTAHSTPTPRRAGRPHLFSQTFLLPWPPSVNAIWRVRHGRNIVAAEYRRWRDAAGKELIIQRPRAFKGPVEVSIRLCAPHNRTWDLDNRVKPLFDLLVNCQVVEGDDHRTIRKYDVATAKGFCGARVTVKGVAA